MVYLGNIIVPPSVENIFPSHKVKMPATAILQCRPNSHPFPDRTLILEEPVKIGRSVARARPSGNNAIFDCKVLSRNHALLWYENGKFYLKDTKSSNGTFVNNYRLSKGSEESAPQEVCSGDIVQYGVDVMENSKKVTHGCIIATLKLYLPDGQEAKASLSTAVGGGMCNISSQELHQLRTSLQEAQHREELIESKLSSFQQIITSIQEAASQSWTAMIDEDRLLQRLETLEDQLATYAKNCSEDSMREEIQRVIEEKNRYETNAKDSLQRILQEKVDAVTRCAELERTLSVTKTELSHKKELAEAAQNELQELLVKQTEQMLELKKLTEKLQSAEEKFKESCDKSEGEKRELELKLQEKASDESNMLVKIESLKADNDFTKEQLSAIKAKYENIKNGRLSFGSITGTDIKADFEFNDEEVKKTFQLFRSAVQALQDRLWQAQEELHQTQSSLTQLKCEAEAADKADLKCQTLKAQLQDELHEKKTKEESNSALIDHLQSQLGALEARLMDISPDTPKIYEDIYEDNNTLCKYKKGARDEDNRDECKDEDNEKEVLDKDNEEDSDSSDSTLTLISTNDIDKNNSLNGDKHRFVFDSESVLFLKEDISKLKEILSLTESSRNSAKEELKRIRDEFGKASTASVTAAHEAANLHHQLAANEAILMEKMRYVSTLQEIGGQLESSVESIYLHLNALTQRIAQQKEEILNSKNECDDVKEKLKEAESLSQNGVDQMEILRAKLKQFEFSLKDTDETSQQNLVLLNSSNLVENFKATENTSHRCKLDNEDSVSKLKTEIETLQRAYEELKESETRLKEKLNEKDVHNSQSVYEISNNETSNNHNSVETLKLELKNLLEEHNQLKEKLKTADNDFHDLYLQNKMKIPTWLMFVMSILVALGWQWLSSLFY